MRANEERFLLRSKSSKMRACVKKTVLGSEECVQVPQECCKTKNAQHSFLLCALSELTVHDGSEDDTQHEHN